MSMAVAELLELFSHHIKLLDHRLEDFVGKIFGLDGVRGTINVNTDNGAVRAYTIDACGVFTKFNGVGEPDHVITILVLRVTVPRKDVARD